MVNTTLVTSLLLLGFSEDPELQTLCGIFFLLMYLVGIISNLLIITVLTLDPQIQAPMYFFLKNLSLLGISLVSVPIPKFTFNSLTHNNSISIPGCALQLLLMTSFSAGEIFILTAVSYDGYVAICCPLHYEAIMNGDACMLMAGVSWALAGLFGVMYTTGMFSGPFCGSTVIPEFFCNVPSLLKISCSDTLLVVYPSLGIGVCLSLSCCVCIMFSYVHILSTVLRIPSRKSQCKAFSTCLPHLVVFSVFMVTAFMVYLRSPSNTPPVIDRLPSVIYTVLPPILNPVIYTLRNGDMKRGLRRLLLSLPDYWVSFI
ncbi:LOW QUALITY PROTEIN: olfactory receptor 14A2 [Heterocephalus glaber]|uniref:LOW QUALITY PROTEIN: olfactory receptor 14A2 n=1 Tax=Heterocephalus glaber TaxID=10181 RepID=A0AAX6P141_HETGA|nr:LOW QUALITY PROTEIN: olfactory receptor 14A2 [Heterocephalus glaber]